MSNITFKSNLLNNYNANSVNTNPITTGDVKPANTNQSPAEQVKPEESKKNSKKNILIGAGAAAGLAAITIGGILLHKKLNTEIVEEALDGGWKQVVKKFKGQTKEIKTFDDTGVLTKFEQGISELEDGSVTIEKITRFAEDGKTRMEVCEGYQWIPDVSETAEKITNFAGDGETIKIIREGQEWITGGSETVKKVTTYKDDGSAFKSFTNVTVKEDGTTIAGDQTYKNLGEFINSNV